MMTEIIQIRVTGTLEEIETALEKLSRVFIVTRQSEPFRQRNKRTVPFQKRKGQTVQLYHFYCDIDLNAKEKELSKEDEASHE